MPVETPVEIIRAALPTLLAAHPQLAWLLDHAALLLHGSTTIGVADRYADWDLWIIGDGSMRATFDRAAGTCFVAFTTPHEGHFQVEAIEDFRRRVATCDFELLSELRHAVVLSDPLSLARELLTDARKPMRDEVRRAWFRYHYVEMRGDHRACDNVINRREDPFPLVIGVTKTLEHALRAAIVLDRQPYRYGKWLMRMAASTATGAKVVALVNEVTRLIGSGGALDRPGPEERHPLTLKLKEIRRVLIDAARSDGLDEPWLTEWWLHIDNARHGVAEVRW